MKKLAILSLVIGCVLLSACNYDDDGRYLSLEIQDALIFENNQNYVVGDTIFFELNFSRYLDETGFSNKLDVFESSGAETFRYGFGLNKFSELSGGFSHVEVSNDFILAEKGEVLEGMSVAIAQLNQNQVEYESRIGIVLVESGLFELPFQNLFVTSYNYSDDKIQIELVHSYSGEIPNFQFTVSE